jgi:hypothetical protein
LIEFPVLVVRILVLGDDPEKSVLQRLYFDRPPAIRALIKQINVGDLST